MSGEEKPGPFPRRESVFLAAQEEGKGGANQGISILQGNKVSQKGKKRRKSEEEKVVNLIDYEREIRGNYREATKPA